MKIVNETELMANQKASTIIVPDKQFEAVQTIEGRSLLFSIGTDGILFCTREVPGDTHGWVRVDLSSSLSAGVYGGAAVVAKTFDIAQDLSSGVNTLDIALVVTVNGHDHLHLATAFTNTFDNWTSTSPSFAQYPFDDYAHPAYAGMPINEVQIVDGNGNQYIIADLITNATTQTISRYYIDTYYDSQNPLYTNPSTSQGCAWVPHNLSIDLQAGSISSFLGCGPNDGPNGAATDIGGIYVLGTIASKAQLMYAPSFNFFNPEMQQNPTIFNLPAGIDAGHMAMGLSAPAATAPYTDLFFASNGSLYFSANADQVDTETTNPTPALIYKHSLFNNIQSIRVSNWNDNIVIWGQSLNPDGSGTSQLFIMEGVAGQETNAASWSCPMPILFDVVNASAYVNNIYSLDSSIDSQNGNAYGSCTVIFAQQVIDQVSSLTQLFQDPITSAWQSRRLLTSPTAENILTEIYDTTTYSTHIEITDDSNITQPNLPVALWASSPCSVYITDAGNAAAYHSLDTTTPLNLVSDASGNITVMQPVDTIGGISYYVAVEDPATKTVYTQVINPLANTVSALNTKVPDGNKDYLTGVQVTAEDGTKSSLVSNAYASQTSKTSNLVNTICQQNANMDQGGLVAGQSWPNATTVAAAFTAVQSPVQSPVQFTLQSAAPASAKIASPAATVPAPKSVRIKHAVPSAAAKSRMKNFAKPDKQARHIRFNPATDKIWGWTHGQSAQQYEGIDALKQIGLVVQSDGSLALKTSTGALVGSSEWTEIKSGHLFKWLQSEAAKLETTLISFADGVVSCVLTIADAVYHFVAKCANDIVNLVHTVLNAIETAFEDIVKWIGMIFSFGDIKNTHLVLKRVMNVYMDYVISNIGTLDGKISSLFTDIETDLSTALGVTPTDQTYGGNMSSAKAPSGSKSPSANWGNHQMKSNASNSSANYSNVTDDPIKDLLEVLYQKVVQEGDNFKTMGDGFLALIETAAGMSITDLLAQVLNIVSDFLLNTAEVMLTAAVDVVKVLITTFANTLNQPMDIPVISYLYKKVTGEDLTPLDAACFIGAIPVTVVYKIVRGQAPFPDSDPTTAQIINAADLNAMQAILMPPSALGATIGIPGYHVNVGSILDQLSIAANIVALTGAAVTSFITAFKSLKSIPVTQDFTPPSDAFTNGLTVLNSAMYFLYSAPDILTLITTANKTETDHWYNDMNNMCMVLGGAKAIVDATTPLWPAKNPLLKELSAAEKYGNYIGPALDLIINVAWQVPTTAILVVNLDGRKASVEDANDIVSFIGGTTFDLSGMLSPVLSATNLIDDIPKREAAVAVVTGGMAYFNLIWGGACVVTSFDGIHTT